MNEEFVEFDWASIEFKDAIILDEECNGLCEECDYYIFGYCEGY